MSENTTSVAFSVRPEDFDDYDDLPASIRRKLQDASFNWNASYLARSYRELLAQGYSERLATFFVCRFIEQSDAIEAEARQLASARPPA